MSPFRFVFNSEPQKSSVSFLPTVVGISLIVLGLLILLVPELLEILVASFFILVGAVLLFFGLSLRSASSISQQMYTQHFNPNVVVDATDCNKKT